MRAKILASILLLLPFSTMAQHHHGMRHFDHYQPYRGGWGWVAPAVIGGAVVYGLSRPAPVVVQQQPVYVQQPSILGQPQVVIIDGIEYTKQTIIINGVSTEVLIRQ
jgi:hypothetical protein